MTTTIDLPAVLLTFFVAFLASVFQLLLTIRVIKPLLLQLVLERVVVVNVFQVGVIRPVAVRLRAVGAVAARTGSGRRTASP